MIIIIIITRVKMYVYFGFSLARLCRARTIDLKCQSRSLRRAFLLRSVCLSVRLTVESGAVCWPTRSQNQSKITANIDRKSIPGEASGHPKSNENRSRDPLRTPRGVQERPEGVSGASRERPGASPARSGSAPKASPERPLSTNYGKFEGSDFEQIQEPKF